MAKGERYDAFISYRHCEPDSEIAERLQRKLETFRLPKEVAKKAGRTRLHRIFRDETELAVADDLSEAIEDALRNSDYLIAVCSPKYVRSMWCMKEIEFFRRYRDQKHILLVLAEGEPEWSFPQMLFYDEISSTGPDGQNVQIRRPREPLAADCRGENKKERAAKIDNAVIRLVAAILGIGYDDLQQRHKKEVQGRKRKRTLIALGILSAVTLICLFFLFRIWKQNEEISRKNREISQQNEEISKKNDEISEQNEIIRQKYADSLAATSDNLLRDGKRRDAVYAARLALPDKKEEGFSESASKALVNALGIYDFPNRLTCDDYFRIPCSLNFFMISPDEKYISVSGLDHIRYIMDIASEELLFAHDDDGYTNPVFDGERGYVFQTSGENIRYYDLNDFSLTDLGVDGALIVSDVSGNGYAMITDEDIMFMRGTSVIGRIRYEDVIPGASAGMRNDARVYYTPGGDAAVSFIYDYDGGTTYVFKTDMETGDTRQFYFSEGMLCFTPSTDGRSVVWTVTDYYSTTLYVVDLENEGEPVGIAMYDIYGTAVLGNDVVCYNDQMIYLMDRDLNYRESMDINSYITDCIISDDEIDLISDDGTVITVKDGHISLYDPDIPVIASVWEKDYKNGKLYIGGTGENYISIYSHRQSDYFITYNEEVRDIGYYDYDAPAVIAFRDLVMANETDFDEDNIFDIVLCENSDVGILQLWDGKVCIYDAVTGEHIKTVYSLDGFVNCFYYDPNLEYYYIGAQSVEVYDKEFRNIFEIRDCWFTGVDELTGNPVVMDISNDEGRSFLVRPIGYSEMIAMADKIIEGYEPDEKVKEKYGLE